MIEINLLINLNIVRIGTFEIFLSEDYEISYLSQVYSMLKGLALC